MCSSSLLLIEAERNLIRLVREKVINEFIYDAAHAQLNTDRESFEFRDLTIDLCLTREFPPVKTPKSNDLIHLRSAKWFMENGGIKKFVSLDKNQIKAADEFGLPVA